LLEAIPINISEIHWHDSEILAVLEILERDEIQLWVMYPTDWQTNTFEFRIVVFDDVKEYVINEGHFHGNPTILSAELLDQTDTFIKIRLLTNSGHRDIICQNVRLVFPSELVANAGALIRAGL